jgi:hypothetical protein
MTTYNLRVASVNLNDFFLIMNKKILLKIRGLFEILNKIISTSRYNTSLSAVVEIIKD